MRHHPDRTRTDSGPVFAEFQSLYEQARKPPEKCGKYEILREIAIGDLRRVCQTRCGKIVKIPRISQKSADRLIKKEQDILGEIHDKTHYQRFVPEVVDSFKASGLVLVTEYPETLYPLSRLGTVDGVHIAWMTRRILDMLGYLHFTGFGHSAITPEHLMFAPSNHAGVLTGFIHTKRLGEPIDLVPAARKSMYTEKVASPRLDLSMLSQCMMAHAIPKWMKSFFQGLAMSHDAWKADEEFTELLQDHYGPPKFHELVVENA